jgi:hypothetical protein
MKMKTVIGILILASICCFCKFQEPTPLTLLTDGTCLKWELLNCESNIENLNNRASNNVMMFCESGKGSIISNDGNRIDIQWSFDDAEKPTKICWKDFVNQQYCYQLITLNTKAMTLYIDNNKSKGYEKRLVCTYKPVVSIN